MYDNERWLLTLVDGVSMILQSLELLFVFHGERLKANLITLTKSLHRTVATSSSALFAYHGYTV